MRILFLVHPYPNYVPDLLLHGLRHLLGTGVVEYPRKACLYEGVIGLGVCPQELLHPGWFPADDGIGREEIPARLRGGWFDYVLCDVRSLNEVVTLLEGARVKGVGVIDGEDQPIPMRPGPFLLFRRETDGGDAAVPLPMALPQEVFDTIHALDGEAKRYPIGFAGAVSDASPERARLIEALREEVPEGFYAVTGVPDGEGGEPAGRLSRREYYRAMQQCRLTLTLPGAGLDTFRFWEHAACRAPQMVRRMPLYIPDDFVEGRHLYRFDGVDQMLRLLDSALRDEDRLEEMAALQRAHLQRHHLTIHRAIWCIDKMREAFGG